MLQYEALTGTKLSYALETLPIPEAMYMKIDAAYFRGLKQILQMDTTYGQMQHGANRTNTNEEPCTQIEI